MANAEGGSVVDEEARLLALAELSVLDTPPEERFDRVTRLCTRIFGVPMALVSFIDRDRQWFKSKQGLDIAETPREIAFCNVAIQEPGVTIIEDAHMDERFRDNPLVTGAPHIRFYAGYPIEARGGERVGTLCLLDEKPRKITVLEVGLLQDLAQWVQKELVIDEELERAAEVQQGLLPRRPPDLPGYDVAARVKSSWLVGGDFFDWFPSPSGTVVALADVMGKGMGGAILMATVRAVLRGAAAQPSLAAGVAYAGVALDDDLSQTDSFFTLFIARIGAGGEVSFVDAGHGLAFVCRADGRVERLRHGGLPVGVFPDTTWDDQTLTLDVGESLVVCSDGLLDVGGEATSAADVDRAVERIAAAVRRHADVQSAVDELTDVSGTDASDDVTVLVVQRKA